MGVTDAGIFGDILCARMQKRGVAALVTDGVVRDLEGVEGTGLPVWCSGAAAPPSVAGLTFVGWQEPVGCGGVAVFPNDVIVLDRDGAVLIGAAGKVSGLDQGYGSLPPVGRAFWSAELDRRKGYAVLDATGTLVTTMKPDEAQASQRFQDTIVYPSGETLMALVPGQPAPIKLGPALSPARDEDGFVLFSDQTGTPAGLLTPKGVWLNGDTAPAWLREAGSMEVREGRLWVKKREGRLLNVVDADGHVLLNPEAVEAAQYAELRAVPLNMPGGPLAMLGQPHCQCGPSGAGLLLADGTLVSDPSWTDLVARDDADDRESDPEPEAGDDVLKPDQLRFAAETDRGLQLLQGVNRGQFIATDGAAPDFSFARNRVEPPALARLHDGHWHGPPGIADRQPRAAAISSCATPPGTICL
ncbi:hypothetical protein G6F57_015288 [Rhizopus arrhizus]|nr:hypothetical protein G6F57_015288 [Rhizopus arrhizus]